MGWGWAASHSQHGLKADFLITQKGDPRDASCIAATTRRPPRTPHSTRPAGRPQSAASPATAPRCPERLGPGARVPTEPAPQSHGLPAPRAAPRPRRAGRARFARRDHRPSRASGLSFSWLVGSCLPPGRGRPPFVVGPPAVAVSLPLTAFAPGLLSGAVFSPPFLFSVVVLGSFFNISLPETAPADSPSQSSLPGLRGTGLIDSVLLKNIFKTLHRGFNGGTSGLLSWGEATRFVNLLGRECGFIKNGLNGSNFFFLNFECGHVEALTLESPSGPATRPHRKF